MQYKNVLLRRTPAFEAFSLTSEKQIIIPVSSNVSSKQKMRRMLSKEEFEELQYFSPLQSVYPRRRISVLCPTVCAQNRTRHKNTLAIDSSQPTGN